MVHSETSKPKGCKSARHRQRNYLASRGISDSSQHSAESCCRASGETTLLICFISSCSDYNNSKSCTNSQLRFCRKSNLQFQNLSNLLLSQCVCVMGKGVCVCVALQLEAELQHCWLPPPVQRLTLARSLAHHDVDGRAAN